MKWLGFRAAFLSTDKNAEAGTKPSQTTETLIGYDRVLAFRYFLVPSSFLCNSVLIS
jgi:hypothetical protein